MSDKQAFDHLIRQHFNIMYTVAVRYTKNHEDADDLVAQSCLLAWKNFGKLNDRGKFKPWVLRIVTNQFFNQYRRDKTRPQDSSTMDEEEDFSLFDALSSPFLMHRYNPEKMFVQRMLASDIKRAIDELPDNFRVVFTLCELEDLSYQEAANVLGLPIGTVRSRLARAKSRLQKNLYEWSKKKKAVRHE